MPHLSLKIIFCLRTSSPPHNHHPLCPLMWNYDTSVSTCVKHLSVSRPNPFISSPDQFRAEIPPKQNSVFRKMSMAVPSTSLRKKGDMLLSGATCDQEREPRGCEGKAASPRPGRLSSPGVWRGWVAQQAQQARRAGDIPPTASNLLLSTTIMVTPWPQASYLQKINGWGRSHVCLRRFAVLPTIELVVLLLEDLRVCAASVDSRWDLPCRRALPSISVLSDQVGRHWQINNWKTNETRIPIKTTLAVCVFPWLKVCCTTARPGWPRIEKINTLRLHQAGGRSNVFLLFLYSYYPPWPGNVKNDSNRDLNDYSVC